jgi:hypothetical protein
MEFTSENRSSNSVNLTRPIPSRCCSFCRRIGHNITSCNDPILGEFENVCVMKCIEFKNIYSENTSKEYLKNWIIDNYHSGYIVRAYAIRKCNCTTKATLILCINKVVEHIYTYVVNTISVDIDVEARIIASMILLYNENDTSNLNNSPIDILNQASIGLRDRVYELLYYANDYIKSYKFDIKISIDETANNDQDQEQNANSYNDVCDCNICYENIIKSNFVKLNCGHEFCKDCIIKSLQNDKRVQACCAYCRTIINNITINNADIKDEFANVIKI